jgi:hypothetical protein
MKPFSSSRFYSDEYFTTTYVYTDLLNNTYTIQGISIIAWDNANGGIQNKTVGDWITISVQKLDLGFTPVVHATLTDGTMDYKIKQVKSEGDSWMLECSTNKRAVK